MAAELPAVEGALEAVADDAAADGHVGAHVRAVGVDDVHLSLLVPEHRELQAWNTGEHAWLTASGDGSKKLFVTLLYRKSP